MLATTSAQTSTFEYAGVFAGFFRDFFGNPRMVLRTGGDELFLGVTAPLRTHLAKLLAPEQENCRVGKGSCRDPSHRTCLTCLDRRTTDLRRLYSGLLEEKMLAGRRQGDLGYAEWLSPPIRTRSIPNIGDRSLSR
jgi:hypothetical protein